MARVDAGQAAPDFTARTQSGETLRLGDLRGRVVVVFFYPKDNTPVCTREACAFRDAYEDFAQAGAVVIGISSDSDESHSAFADRHRLPYHLVSDADGALRSLFGVPKTLGLFPGRTTYVIDRQGIVRNVLSAAFASDRHVQESLAVVRQLMDNQPRTG